MALDFDKVVYKVDDYEEWSRQFGDELASKLAQAVTKAKAKYNGKEVTIYFTGKATSDGTLYVQLLTTCRRHFHFFGKTSYKISPIIVCSVQ